MEILAVIGVILAALFLFVICGLLGWVFKGVGSVFSFLMEGCGTTLGVILWIILGFFLLAALCM
jgi:hypothetical protein